MKKKHVVLFAGIGVVFLSAICHAGEPATGESNWQKFKRGAKEAGGAAWSGTKNVAGNVAEGAHKAGGAVATGAKKTGAFIAEGYEEVKEHVVEKIDSGEEAPPPTLLESEPETAPLSSDELQQSVP